MIHVHSRPCFLTPQSLNPDYPLFVFLPGMDGTGELLRTQTAGLGQGFNVRCLAIPPDDLTSWDDLAGQVIQLIKAELTQAQFPVYLCGESFGGCLAMKVALKAPELFARIILVNPASAFRHRSWMKWGSQAVQWLPSPVYRLSSAGLLPFLAAPHRMAPEDRHALLETMTRVPQRTSVWRLSLLSEFDVLEPELSDLTQPVLLVASAADRLLPSVAEANRLLSYLPNANLVVLPESGHACLLESDVFLYEIMQSHDFLPTTAELAES